MDMLAKFSARRQLGEPFIFDPEVMELFKERVVTILPLTADGQLCQMEDRPPAVATGQTPPVGERSSHTPWWKFWN